ncbi:MAG: hypothetical protein P8I92_06205 [Schleiferiaceae bacterium]|nr:hypothetical protein [Schleiferiaceae bacterium]
MRRFFLIALIALLSSCSNPLLVELNRLEKDLNDSRNLISMLYDRGFEAALKDLQRHAEIAERKVYSKENKIYFTNEFEILKIRHKEMIRLHDFLSVNEIKGRIEFDSQQINDLRHDIKNHKIEKHEALKSIENEKNAIIPYLADLNNRINYILKSMDNHDSVDNHLQFIWDNWDHSTP